MSNALPTGVTRYIEAQRVSAPASASASENQPITVLMGSESNLHAPPTPAEWDYLLAERIGIMHESGMTLDRARALALGDTVRTHGPNPGAGQ